MPLPPGKVIEGYIREGRRQKLVGLPLPGTRLPSYSSWAQNSAYRRVQPISSPRGQETGAGGVPSFPLESSTLKQTLTQNLKLKEPSGAGGPCAEVVAETQSRLAQVLRSAPKPLVLPFDLLLENRWKTEPEKDVSIRSLHSCSAPSSLDIPAHALPISHKPFPLPVWHGFPAPVSIPDSL